MNQQKPEYFRPALVAGAVAGLLSALPIIGAGNCLCCLWIVGGGAVAARILSARTPALLRSGDGAVVGALTGIVAAVVDSIATVPFRRYNLELARRIFDSLPDLGSEMPAGLDGLLEGSGALSPGWMLLGLFFSAAVFMVAGVLGGIIGVAIFAKKAAPPTASQPPAAPPAAPGGPSDAA